MTSNFILNFKKSVPRALSWDICHKNTLKTLELHEEVPPALKNLETHTVYLCSGCLTLEVVQLLSGPC